LASTCESMCPRKYSQPEPEPKMTYRLLQRVWRDDVLQRDTVHSTIHCNCPISGQVLPPDATQKRGLGLCRHAVSVLSDSVCLSVTFVDSVKTNKHIFSKIFHRRLYPHHSSISTQKAIAIFRRGPRPITGASNASKNRDCHEYLAIVFMVLYTAPYGSMTAEVRNCEQQNCDSRSCVYFITYHRYHRYLLMYYIVSVVNDDTVNCFKSRLDKFWANQELMYNFRSEIHETGSRSKVVY